MPDLRSLHLADFMAMIERQLTGRKTKLPKQPRTSGTLIPLKEGGYRFEWDKPRPPARSRPDTADERAFQAFSRTFTDEVSEYTSAGLARETQLRLNWLHKSGTIALWVATNYGRKPEGRPNDAA